MLWVGTAVALHRAGMNVYVVQMGQADKYVGIVAAGVVNVASGNTLLSTVESGICLSL
jgi:hypothetical protein